MEKTLLRIAVTILELTAIYGAFEMAIGIMHDQTQQAIMWGIFTLVCDSGAGRLEKK
jgi:hypothetical protein